MYIDRPKLLQWELDWIKQHSDLYEGPMHIKAVSNNIIKHYHNKHIEQLVRRLHQNNNEDNMLELTNYYGITVCWL